jgi:hypothetical protein
MTELAVITPCFRGDADVFADLHRSVLEFTPPGTVHHVYVPFRDRGRFAEYEGPRCRIWDRSELLPPRYLRAPLTDLYVNIRRPWPPLRGWVMQQTTKIAAAGQSDADIVLLIDSDVVLVRPVDPRRFIMDGQVCLYRVDGGVTAGMKRHVIWHRVARELLGIPQAPPPPLPDYVGAVAFWAPATVRAMQEQIRGITEQDWLDAFNSQPHISEFILYGVFVDEMPPADPHRVPIVIDLCHEYYKRTPMNLEAAIAFAEQIQPEAIAMMISSHSQTPMDVRRAAIRRSREIVKSS